MKHKIVFIILFLLPFIAYLYGKYSFTNIVEPQINSANNSLRAYIKNVLYQEKYEPWLPDIDKFDWKPRLGSYILSTNFDNRVWKGISGYVGSYYVLQADYSMG